MPTLEKKSKDKDFNESPKVQEVNPDHVAQLQKNIRELQAKLDAAEKTNEVQKNLLGQQGVSQAINPQNLKAKLAQSGHPPDIQALILRAAN